MLLGRTGSEGRRWSTNDTLDDLLRVGISVNFGLYFEDELFKFLSHWVVRLKSSMDPSDLRRLDEFVELARDLTCEAWQGGFVPISN